MLWKSYQIFEPTCYFTGKIKSTWKNYTFMSFMVFFDFTVYYPSTDFSGWFKLKCKWRNTVMSCLQNTWVLNLSLWDGIQFGRPPALACTNTAGFNCCFVRFIVRADFVAFFRQYFNSHALSVWFFFKACHIFFCGVSRSYLSSVAFCRQLSSFDKLYAYYYFWVCEQKTSCSFLLLKCVTFVFYLTFNRISFLFCHWWVINMHTIEGQ